MRFFFGIGALPVALLMVAVGALGVWHNFRESFQMPWSILAGAELALLALLSLVHLFWPTPDPLTLAHQGLGGGYVGWAISSLLSGLMGKAGAAMFLLAILISGAALIARPRWEISERREAPAPKTRMPRPRKRAKPSPGKESPRPSKPASKTAEPKPATPRLRQSRRGLPPLNLLEIYPQSKYNSADIRYKAELLEKTLASFNIPARIVAINRGPVVTQFGVEPGYIERAGKNGKVRRTRVKVSKIASLADDIALALAASPVRIEAPVPGRPYVGIEVPNDEPSLVSLREVMESKEFKELKSPLKLALGKGISGQPVVADLALMPHLLIAGATGSGKSVCINSIVTCLVMQHPPERLRLLLMDPKRVELVHFNGLPHLLGPVVVEVDQAIAALTWLVRAMEERYNDFAHMRARNLEEYNAKAPSRGKEPLPYIILIIDELADIMIAAGDEAEMKLTRLAQLSRATGIHLILATQRPSVDVITGLIKANFPARISFAVTSQVDSRVILDMAGAERLLGRGDMLFLPPDRPSPIRLQGCYVSGEEVRKVVNWWREKRPLYLEESREIPWEGLLQAEEEDELLSEALELLSSYRKVSISLLQRKLHLGYPRAARLMEQLEARGYVRYDESLSSYVVVDEREAVAEG